MKAIRYLEHSAWIQRFNLGTFKLLLNWRQTIWSKE